ncbi:rhomboid family protein [Grosmannia clavigera kw1407]|uniref:Rhomboid family protein n=1 Tax=Grosmannia clavigera (strain kw1407 / UAMH 11150) TaxID=655863 RepID=F0XKW3_GROCL|nr:rhomboid family protein [Grosmannia clavigera kw1407]EFX01649.1 rhomboid family protein [Grosmannia clavigera kw1407]
MASWSTADVPTQSSSSANWATGGLTIPQAPTQERMYKNKFTAWKWSKNLTQEKASWMAAKIEARQPKETVFSHRHQTWTKESLERKFGQDLQRRPVDCPTPNGITYQTPLSPNESLQMSYSTASRSPAPGIEEVVQPIFYLDKKPLRFHLVRPTVPDLRNLLDDASRAASAKNYVKADADFREAVSGFRFLLSPTHEETLRAGYEYASFYAKSGNMDKADEVLDWMSENHVSKWHHGHENTCLHYSRMAKLFLDWGRQEDAETLVYKILDGTGDYITGVLRSGSQHRHSVADIDLEQSFLETDDSESMRRQLEKLDLAITTGITGLDNILEVILKQCENHPDDMLQRPVGATRRRPAGSARTLFTSAVPKHYVDLPPTYEDDVGLPFRRGGDLERQQVAEIFGVGMNPAVANRLLRILHGRRVAGTLDDPAYRVNTARYPQAEIDAALAYLRRTVPVDEVINAGLRAEDELAELEQGESEETTEAETEETAEDGHASGRKKALQSLTEHKWRARLFREAPSDEVYGMGAFDAIRARNRLKEEERERLRQAEQKLREEEEAKLAASRGGGRGLERVDGSSSSSSNGGRFGLRIPDREMSPQMQKWAVAATSPLQEAPTMSSWQRLWPSTLFVVSLVVGGGVVASVYEPPAEEQRLVPGLSSATTTVLGLVAANVAVWLLWRVPPAWRLLNRYMIVVPATPRPLSLVGAMFSHQKTSHLLANVAFVWFIGLRLHDEIGRAAFLEVYFASGALAFLASMANIVLRNNLHLTTLGASGAIYGITTAYFMLHKFEGFKILGLPPDPYGGIQGLGFIGLMLGLNLLTLRAEKQAIDVVTHFAGMAVGALFGQYFSLVRDEQVRAATENRPPRRLWAVLTDGDAARVQPVAEK